MWLFCNVNATVLTVSFFRPIVVETFETQVRHFACHPLPYTTGIKVRKTTVETKFKLRMGKYLWTLVLPTKTETKKIDKVMKALPPALQQEKQEIKVGVKRQ
jgi:hypothetical protein